MKLGKGLKSEEQRAKEEAAFKLKAQQLGLTPQQLREQEDKERIAEFTKAMREGDAKQGIKPVKQLGD